LSHLHMRLKSTQDCIRIGFKHDGRLAQSSMQSLIVGRNLSVFRLRQKLSTMVVNRVLRVLERVAGKDEDDSLFASDLAHGNKLFESGEGNGRGRLATYALSADLGFGKGDLLLGDLFAPAAEPVDDVGSLAPGGGIADADRRSPGVCGNGTHHAVGVHEPAVER